MDAIYAYVDGGYLRSVAMNEVEPTLENPWLDPWRAITESHRVTPHSDRERVLGTLDRLNYYDAEDADAPEAEAIRRYFNAVEQLPDCSVRTGEVRMGRRGRGRGREQKGVDVLLAVEMLTDAHAQNFTDAFLLAGDADFVPLVDEVRRLGRRVFVVAHTRSLSQALAEAADRVVLIVDEMAPEWGLTLDN